MLPVNFGVEVSFYNPLNVFVTLSSVTLRATSSATYEVETVKELALEARSTSIVSVHLEPFNDILIGPDNFSSDGERSRNI